MSCITRSIFRYGVIGGLALGGITLLVGPERVAAGLAQARTQVQGVVDQCVDDPIALRRQLEQLAEQYPDRIAEVRGEIAEVDHQIAQFDRDIAIAQRVVALATDDLQDLKGLVARAEAQQSDSRAVFIRHEGVRFDVDEAYDEGRRINNVRSAYADRLAHDEFQRNFLDEQRGRLDEILAKLEDEYSTYQSQLWQLDRQIDAIQRNERLIELTEQQQATLDSYERFGKLDNLKQLEAKLAELRAKQEAQLQHLEQRGIHSNYEEQAIYELDGDRLETIDPFDDVLELNEAEIEEAETASTKSMAWAGPIVIE